MSVQALREGSDWQLLQTTELPEDSYCRQYLSVRAQHYWHAWDARYHYCGHHSDLKAPTARVVANRRRDEALRRPRQSTMQEVQTDTSNEPPSARGPRARTVPPTGTTQSPIGRTGGVESREPEQVPRPARTAATQREAPTRG